MLEFILEAMEEEIERSKGIKLEGHKVVPHYISYILHEIEKTKIVSENGAIIEAKEDSHRTAGVRVNVGSYEHSATGISGCVFMQDTLKNNSKKRLKHYICKNFWELTDTAFKAALEQYHDNASGSVENFEESDSKDGFSQENPHVYIEDEKSLVFEKAKWETIAREASEKIGSHDFITDHEISIEARRDADCFLSTEGTKLFHQKFYYTIQVKATARCLDHKTGKEDGYEVDNAKSYYARDISEMPSKDVLMKGIEQMIADLDKLRKAEIFRPKTTYPAIIDHVTHATFLHEVIGHRLEAEGVKDETTCNPFQGNLGEMVMKEFITLEMDPTIEKFKEHSLYGNYKFDDEGIAAQKVILVENGVLKDFLRCRDYLKIEGSHVFKKSNGHGRCEYSPGWWEEDEEDTFNKGIPIARMSNLIVKSSKSVSYGQLKEELIKECKKQKKQYGLIIEGGNAGETELGAEFFHLTPKFVYKVNADTGEETLVRGVEIVGTPLEALDSMIMTDDNYDVSYGYCGSESGWVPVSEIAQRALVRSIALKRKSEKKKKGRLLPSPAKKE